MVVSSFAKKLVIISTFLCCSQACLPPQNKIPLKPNVIIIYTDDMNFEDLGHWGGNVLTPTIDQLAGEGVTLNNFYITSAVCSPSRYSLLTGKYASRCKDLQRQFPTHEPAFIRWNTFITKDETTLAHLMNAGGYTTGMVGKYHNIHNESFQDTRAETLDPKSPEGLAILESNYKAIQDSIKKTAGFDYVESFYGNNLHALALPEELQYHNMEWVTSAAINFIDQNKDNPFFLYVPVTIPHGPPPVASMKKDPGITPLGAYIEIPSVQAERESLFTKVKNANLPEDAAVMAWLDDAIEAIINQLQQNHLLENTLIVFASDHGGGRSKMTCYEKGVRSPAFIYWKNHIQPCATMDQLTANIDIVPTILDVCGITPPENLVLDGSSLWPALNGKEYKEREDLYLEITYSRGVVTKDKKYIAVRFPNHIATQITTNNRHLFNHEGVKGVDDMVAGNIHVRYNADELYPHYFDADQLYDLTKDAHEQLNLVGNTAYTSEVQNMKSRLSYYCQQFPHAFGEFNN